MGSRVTPELLERLLDEHGAALELFASQWTNAPEDCVQEALLQLVRQPRLPDRVVAWLYRVVRNRGISHRRSLASRSRHETAAGLQRGEWFVPDKDLPFDVKQVSEALQGLPDELREVVVAKIWGNLTFDEIAEVVGGSRSGAHRRYTDALRALRERLEGKWKDNKMDAATDSTNSNAT